jgi:hypothetical protein
MSKYTQKGSRFLVGKDADTIIHDELPAGTYTMSFDQMIGYFLTATSDFNLPPKVYGKAPQHAHRIIDTFKARPNGTGVHLDGTKGSGKTLLVKSICVEAAKQGIPTIIVNEPYCGDEFNSFIQSIQTPTIIVFDEFEKTYDTDAQSKILTLFDGVYPSKKMFLLTTNESWRVSDFLKNRPGRMYYSMKFDVIEADVIKEYLEDNLNDKSQIERIIKYSQVFTFLNFDMLAAVVEEMNRYGETLAEVLTLLNVQPEMRANEMYDISLSVNGGKDVHLSTTGEFDPNEWEYYFCTREIKSALGIKEEEDDDEYGLSVSQPDFDAVKVSNSSAYSRGINMYPEHLSGFDGVQGMFTYTTKMGDNTFVAKVTRQSLIGGGKGVFNYNAI